MSDPAIEVAQRVWHAWTYTDASLKDLAEAAAREALKPIRELHKTSWDNCINACCSGADCKHRTQICGHCWDQWPCDTAKLIYTTEELAR